MSDIQVLTVAIAVIVPISLLLYSNTRVNDAKETLRAEIALAKETLRAEMARGFENVLAAIRALETKLEIHELEHHHK